MSEAIVHGDLGVPEAVRLHPMADWTDQCARCGSSVTHVDCENCEDGYSHHDCGEDSCCCLHPENNVRCDVCEGHGGWRVCLSSAEWCNAHPLPGRENVERGKIEWVRT